MKKLKESIVNFKNKHEKGLKALNKGLNVFIIVVVTFLVGLFFIGAIKGCYSDAKTSDNVSLITSHRSNASRFANGSESLESYYTAQNYLNVEGQSNHYDKTNKDYIYSLNSRSDLNMIFFNPSSTYSTYSNVSFYDNSSSIITNTLKPTNSTFFSNTYFFGAVQLFSINSNGFLQLNPSNYGASFSFTLNLSSGSSLTFYRTNYFGNTAFSQSAVETSSSLSVSSIKLNYISFSNVPFNIESNSIVAVFYACLVYDQYIFDTNSSVITSHYFAYLNNRLSSTFYNLYVSSYFSVMQPTIDSDDVDSWYNLGYNKGYNTGYNVGSDDGYEEGVASAQSASYDRGYQDGYTIGSKGDTHNSLSGLFLTAFQSPFHLFQQMFDVEFLGMNLGSFIISLFSVLLVAFIIKRLI